GGARDRQSRSRFDVGILTATLPEVRMFLEWLVLFLVLRLAATQSGPCTQRDPLENTNGRFRIAAQPPPPPRTPSPAPPRPLFGRPIRAVACRIRGRPV